MLKSDNARHAFLHGGDVADRLFTSIGQIERWIDGDSNAQAFVKIE